MSSHSGLTVAIVTLPSTPLPESRWLPNRCNVLCYCILQMCAWGCVHLAYRLCVFDQACSLYILVCLLPGSKRRQFKAGSWPKGWRTASLLYCCIIVVITAMRRLMTLIHNNEFLFRT